ncbi:hypothetical protein [Agarilytica rhodophyticola]|uniref:hypothetical protein n=1 Tax=Agarilytica rhodophyticola TaxID=1737490 RepID=UPI000B345672|nr:hypothetical protein [Agarilytica rhodophyticola]
MKTFYTIFLIIGLTTTSLYSYASTKHERNADIWNIIASFKQAIAGKDKEKFLSLFVEEEVSWIGVISDQTRQQLIEKNKKFEQQPKVIHSTPENFIDDIVKNPASLRETFDNVEIVRDNDVASVVFDYVFYQNDTKRNWGQESWLLINTTKGWKIHAVNFSHTLNPVVLEKL